MTYYVMGMGEGFTGFKTHSPHTQTNIFLMNSGRKKREKYEGDVYIFYIVDTCEPVQKHWSWHYLFRTVGGGEGLKLVEAEIFSGVGGGGVGVVIIFRELNFLCGR